MTQQGMGSVQEILARCLGQPGYIQEVRRVGLINVKTEANDLNDEQLNTLHVCIQDAEIFGHIVAIHERYPEVKKEFDLSAYPWYD